MARASRLTLMALLAAGLFAGCLRAPEAETLTPDARPDATAYPTSPVEALPEIAISDLVVKAGDEENEWQVLGMAMNDSSTALGAVRLRIELVDAAGTPTAETTVSVPLSVLQPQASSPFAAKLHHSGAPAGARVRLESFLFSSAETARTRAGAIFTTQIPDGAFVQGTLQAGDPGPIRVLDAVIAWRGADKSLAGVTPADIPAASTTQGGSLPWIAFAKGAGPDSRFEVFAVGAAADPSNEVQLVLDNGPEWRITSQGDGFATGAIRNRGGVAAFPQVAVAAHAAGRLISLQILESRVPLLPGETLTFAADRFPGLEAALEAEGIDLAEVTLETYLNAKPVPTDTGPPVLLPVAVRQFEVIGSRLFLRGSIASPASVSLQSAIVFVSLRSTAGEPLSARWLELHPPPSQTEGEFSADLPIPAGVDAALCEFDVRALGVPVSDSSW